jgi:PHS family inorganic phosphate transporter-like MFS transporter
MLGVVFWQTKAGGGKIPSNSDTAIKVATSGGTVIGQLGFGYLADVVGRKKMYGLELIIIIFATLAQALSSPSRAISIVGLIIFWRVLMVSWSEISKVISSNRNRVSELVVITHYLPLSHPNSLLQNGEVP